MALKAVKKRKEEERNELIVQHNNLMEARYRLSLQEKRLVLWLASQVKLTDEDFKEHVLSINEFAKLTGVRKDRLYSDLQTITRRLMQRIISIYPIGENRLIQVAWLGGADYKFDEGTVSLSFHPHLQPFMLNLRDHFTALNLSDLMGLQSVYSVRIFELLKQYESIGKREISLKDLREYCGIAPDKYKKFNNFKKRILESAQREINEKTDLEIRFEEIKNVRQVSSILFHLSANKDYHRRKNDPETQKKIKSISREILLHDDLIKRIIAFGFSRRTAVRLMEMGNDDEIEAALKAVDVQIDRGHVKNTKAMVQAAIKDRWKPGVFVSKKIKTKS